jgi:2-oxoglutarate ferredoxin oxidoreductase subunit alpha
MELLTGNEIITRAAIAAGADAFFGYPITPTTEILTHWAEVAAKDKNMIFLQTEDETAAGFGVIGAALGGKKAWTATAGVGHLLMQDPMVMAEAMRIPFVTYIGQRGGPSTGTVIYSQQELSVARDGGNGEGMRLVLGPSNLQELYDFTILAFDWAWRYSLPVIILGDGYLSKMTGQIETRKLVRTSPAKRIIQDGKKPVNMRNCYSLEEELAQVLHREMKDYGEISKIVEKSETSHCVDAQVVVFAWGSVAGAAKEAVKNLRTEGKKVGLFRPITLKPFSATRARQAVSNAHTILIVESSMGKFSQIVTESLFELSGIKVAKLLRPAEGIVAADIETKLRELLS